MGEWRKFNLLELADVYNEKRKPLSKMQRLKLQGKYPYYGASGIVDFINDYKFDGDFILISEDGENLKTRKTPIVFKASGKFWVNNHAHILKGKKTYLDDLLIYFFTNLDLNQYLTGAVQPKLSKGTLLSIPIYLPSEEKEQKAIAEVLSSLDDKIDLLHRQNKTLENIAQTLFRQWFIEEAKDEWAEKPLSKIANFLNGLACQKFPPKNDVDKLPVLKIKDLKAGISDSSDWATTDIKPEYIIESGDVIFAWSASLIVKIWDGERCILNQHLFKVTSDDYPKWFYYQWCKYHLDRFIAIAQAHATTMGHIKRKDLDNAMCFVPSDDEITVMNEQIVPLMQKLENNSKQIKSLENMRDTLLPKLMSGEVGVK